MWPAIAAALENATVVRHHKAKTKILKATKRLPNFMQHLCLLGCSLKMPPVVLIFEEENLPLEVKPLIK